MLRTLIHFTSLRKLKLWISKTIFKNNYFQEIKNNIIIIKKKNEKNKNFEKIVEKKKASYNDKK